MDDHGGRSAADLLESNRDLQGSPTVRLLAATNLSLYSTLMDRHLSGGVVAETELVVRLERDLVDLGDDQSGLALIKSWASQGWLHRIVDERTDQNVCYLTQDARRALDFLRGMRRQDTIATGGSINGIAGAAQAGRAQGRQRPRPHPQAHRDRDRVAATRTRRNSRPANGRNPTSPTPTTRPGPSPCRWNASSPTSASTAR